MFDFSYFFARSLLVATQLFNIQCRRVCLSVTSLLQVRGARYIESISLSRYHVARYQYRKCRDIYAIFCLWCVCSDMHRCISPRIISWFSFSI